VILAAILLHSIIALHNPKTNAITGGMLSITNIQDLQTGTILQTGFLGVRTVGRSNWPEHLCYISQGSCEVVIPFEEWNAFNGGYVCIRFDTEPNSTCNIVFVWYLTTVQSPNKHRVVKK
jgi:hypothetical protein